MERALRLHQACPEEPGRSHGAAGSFFVEMYWLHTGQFAEGAAPVYPAFPAAVALVPLLGVTLGDSEMEICSKMNETNMLAEPCG